MRRQDGHGNEPTAISLMDVRRQAAGLTPEDQNDTVAGAEWRVPQELRRLRRKEVRFAEPRQLDFERVPAWPDAQVHMLPVVKAGAFHLTLVEREAEWLDEVQNCAGSEARSARVAGVPVNLRMHEDYVDRQVGSRVKRRFLLGTTIDLARRGAMLQSLRRWRRPTGREAAHPVLRRR